MDCQNVWERKSLVRSQSRRLIGEVEGDYFPPKLQWLCQDSYIGSLGKEAINFILVQTLYKFLSDIAFLENEVVASTVLKVVFNNIPIKVDWDTRLTLMTVVVDETYHSYASLDYMKQIQEKTRIMPLPFSNRTAISRAIQFTKLKLAEQYHSLFELIAVCLAENSITKEVFYLASENGTNQFFKDIMNDHFSDEARHSVIFQHLLKKIWSEIEEESKEVLGNILPIFIKQFLSVEPVNEFNEQILEALKIDKTKTKEILEATTAKYPVTKDRLMVKNIIQCIQKAHILDHPSIKKIFLAEGLLPG